MAAVVVRRLALLSALVCLFSTVGTLTTWALLRVDSAGPVAVRESAPASSPSSGRERAALDAGQERSGAVAPAAATVRAMRARAVLVTWDAHRASAWADADVARLRALYAPGSRTGRLDVRMLRRWRAREMRVEGMTTQVHALRVLASSPGHWRLRVTDRLVGAVAVGPTTRLPLPGDGWTERTLELRRAGRGWQVVEARRSARP